MNPLQNILLNFSCDFSLKNEPPGASVENHCSRATTEFNDRPHSTSVMTTVATEAAVRTISSVFNLHFEQFSASVPEWLPMLLVMTDIYNSNVVNLCNFSDEFDGVHQLAMGNF